MDQDSIERIREANFSKRRRGYDREEVDEFLSTLADWLETGGADQTRSELITRELQRVTDATRGILMAADEAARKLRVEAERERERMREETEQTRADSAADIERELDAAREQARRIVDEAKRKRADIEALISDLEERREALVAEVERFASEITSIGASSSEKPEGEEGSRVGTTERAAP